MDICLICLVSPPDVVNFNQFAASANHQFEFEKRSQLFIRVYNKTLSIVAMRVFNSDCSPVGIHR
jgi:hypothetical protein